MQQSYDTPGSTSHAADLKKPVTFGIFGPFKVS
jgi:hypothetical protein